MSTKEAFGRICERVCEEQGWELQPSGVRIDYRDGRHQVVSLEFFESDGHDLVRLWSPIGDSRALGVERLALALQVNARLAHGALAVREEQLIMTETLLLRDADPGELRASLESLAATADYYEKIFFGTDEH